MSTFTLGDVVATFCILFGVLLIGFSFLLAIIFFSGAKALSDYDTKGDSL